MSANELWERGIPGRVSGIGLSRGACGPTCDHSRICSVVPVRIIGTLLAQNEMCSLKNTALSPGPCKSFSTGGRQGSDTQPNWMKSAAGPSKLLPGSLTWCVKQEARSS
jgi:hypothetical protein